eukprot:8195195-Prorocentrum_lima.AAC.1
MPLQTRAVMKHRMAIRALRRDCKSGDGVLEPMSQTEVSSEGSFGQKGALTDVAGMGGQTRNSHRPDTFNSGIGG